MCKCFLIKRIKFFKVNNIALVLLNDHIALSKLLCIFSKIYLIFKTLQNLTKQKRKTFKKLFTYSWQCKETYTQKGTK